ncbi:hypothetical protein TWF730_011285 [Orbilia blumenaviensis]|uniref:F-box domain-containing protein n=1 Tax=Orbilia blumenaviensis TaxID=1796055 RepID=A0AAV9UM84_9PEZI
MSPNAQPTAIPHPAETPTENSHLVKLPLEIQTEIISYVPRDSLLGVSKTCRQLRAISLRQYFRKACICTETYGCSLKLLRRYPDLRPAVRHLQLSFSPTLFVGAARATMESDLKARGSGYGTTKRAYAESDSEASDPCEQLAGEKAPTGGSSSPRLLGRTKILAAVSERYFQNLTQIHINCPASQANFLKYFINLLSKHQPAHLTSLSMRLQGSGSAEMRERGWDQSEISFPAGMKHITYGVNPFGVLFSISTLIGPSLDTLISLSMTSHAFKKFWFPPGSVCPTLKIFKTDRRECSIETADKMNRHFPNLEELWFKDYSNLDMMRVIFSMRNAAAGQLKAEHIRPQTWAWCSGWKTLKHVKRVRIHRATKIEESIEDYRPHAEAALDNLIKIWLAEDIEMLDSITLYTRDVDRRHDFEFRANIVRGGLKMGNEVTAKVVPAGSGEPEWRFSNF